MASPGITRLKFYLLINIRQPLSAHGELSPIENYLLVSKTLVLLSNGPCRMLSTISSILQNLTLMTYLPTHPIDQITLITYELFLFDVGFTISA
jgi:hypothetical protein